MSKQQQQQYDPTVPITRKQFFSRLRKLGFKKADMELSRNSITYERRAGAAQAATKECPYDWQRNGVSYGLPDEGVDVRITLPKGHTQVVQVIGGRYSGWHIEHGGRHVMGSPIPEGWDLLGTVLGLFNGGIGIGG